MADSEARTGLEYDDALDQADVEEEIKQHERLYKVFGDLMNLDPRLALQSSVTSEKLAKGRVLSLAANAPIARLAESTTIDMALVCENSFDQLLDCGYWERLEWLKKHPKSQLVLGVVNLANGGGIHAHELTSRSGKSKWTISPCLTSKVTKQQADHAGFHIICYSGRPDVFSLVPSAPKSLSEPDPLLHFSHIPPVGQPWAVPMRDLVASLDRLRQAIVYKTDYCNTATGVVLPKSKLPQITTTQSQLILEDPDSNLDTANDRAFRILNGILRSMAGDWRLEKMDIRPLLANAMICRPSPLSPLYLELKLNMISESAESVKLEWLAPSGNGGPQTKTPNPFTDYRRGWHYLFTVDEKNGYAYFVPRTFAFANLALLQRDDQPHGIFPKQLLNEFRIELNDRIEAYRKIRAITERHPKAKVPALKYRSFDPQEATSGQSSSLKFDRASAPMAQVAHGATARAFWIFENVVSHCARRRHGLLLPLLKGHDFGDAIFVHWTWTQADVDGWDRFRQLPTGIGLDSMPSSTPGVRVRLLLADRSPNDPNALGIDAVEPGQFVDMLKTPALCIFDLHGRAHAQQEHGYCLIPSEWIEKVGVRTSPVRHVTMTLKRPHHVQEFMAAESGADGDLSSYWTRSSTRTWHVCRGQRYAAVTLRAAAASRNWTMKRTATIQTYKKFSNIRLTGTWPNKVVLVATMRQTGTMMSNKTTLIEPPG